MAKTNPGQFGHANRPDTLKQASRGGQASGGKIKDSKTASAMGKKGAEVRNQHRQSSGS